MVADTFEGIERPDTSHVEPVSLGCDYGFERYPPEVRFGGSEEVEWVGKVLQRRLDEAGDPGWFQTSWSVGLEDG